MRKTALPLMLAMMIPLLNAVPAKAQATRTFVSGQGNDANACTLAAPCQHLQAALTRTAAGGEINLLDSADFGPVTITKAISIVSDGVTGGIMAASGGTGITINAGPNDVIDLHGLDIEGQGSGASGIVFNTGGSLNIQSCVIRGFTSVGINFEPTASSALTVSDTLVSDNTAGTGIILQNMGSGIASGAFSHVEVVNNGAGVSVVDSNSIGSINVTIESSAVANNSAVGILANGSAVFVTVVNSTIANNGVGLQAQSGALAHIGQSTTTGNQTGLLVSTSGQVISSGQNSISGNQSGNTVPTNLLLDGTGGNLLDASGGRIMAL